MMLQSDCFAYRTADYIVVFPITSLFQGFVAVLSSSMDKTSATGWQSLHVQIMIVFRLAELHVDHFSISKC
jgi:hypothetical protein